MTWNPSLIDGPIAIEGVEGYHLNAAPQIVGVEVEPFVVEPQAPVRVFAGDLAPSYDQTTFLRFASEAEAIAVLGAYWIEEVE